MEMLEGAEKMNFQIHIFGLAHVCIDTLLGEVDQ